MQDSLSATFAALADPTRRAILARLAAGDASVGELAEPFKISARAVSKHVGVLETAGLITRTRDAQRRPSHLQLAPLREADGWLGTYRQLWHDRLDQLEFLIEQGQDCKSDQRDTSANSRS